MNPDQMKLFASGDCVKLPAASKRADVRNMTMRMHLIRPDEWRIYIRIQDEELFGRKTVPDTA
jgi:hypothetical protein